MNELLGYLKKIYARKGGTRGAVVSILLYSLLLFIVFLFSYGVSASIGNASPKRTAVTAYDHPAHSHSMTIGTDSKEDDQDSPAGSNVLLPISELLIDKDKDGSPDRLGQRVTVSGRTIVGSGVMAGQSLKVYLQDQSAGILLFADSVGAPIVKGDSLVVNGRMAVYSGTPEVIVENYEIIDTPSRIPLPAPLDSAFTDPSRYHGMLVSGDGVVTRTEFGNDATMLRISPEDTSDFSLYAFVSRSNKAYDEFNFDNLSVGDHIAIEGIIDRHYSAYLGTAIYEILPRSPDDIGYLGLPRQYRTYILWASALLILIVMGWVVVLRRQVKVQTQKLSKALEEREILMQEMHHRVKNNLTSISGILELQKYEPVESVDTLIDNTQSRIGSIAKIHKKLYQAETLSDIDMQEYVEEFSDSIVKTFKSPHKDIVLHKNLQSFRLGIINAVPLGLIINELLSNAYQHGFDGLKEGDIKLTLEKRENEAVVTVADNGNPLPENFSLENSGSLGCTLIKSFTEQLEGAIDVTQNGWTTFRVTVPVSEEFT